MHPLHSPLEQVSFVAKLADLKEDYYRNTLAVSALIELLIDKGIITRQEIEQKAAQLHVENTVNPSTHPIS